MHDFVQAVRIALEQIPCMGPPAPHTVACEIDIGCVVESHQALSDVEQAWLDDCWQAFREIVEQQNAARDAAMELIGELERRSLRAQAIRGTG